MRRPASLTSAFAVAALCVLSASAQLNPTVTVLPKPQTQVPSECEEGLAVAQPRTLIAQAPPQVEPPKRVAAPPSIDLKTRLRRVQTAAEQENRDESKAALADARTSATSYPAGGERDAAADVLRVYDDLERLWDYSFASPTGAFFDATSENGALVNMMRRYPDWTRSISDTTLNIGGQTIYPTRETRRFLTAEASKRLTRLGVRLPTRITEAPPPRVVPSPQPAPTVRQATKPPAQVTPRPTRKTTTTTTVRKAHRKPTTKIAAAGPAASRPASGRRATSYAPTPSPVPAPPSGAPAGSPVPLPSPRPVTTTAPPPPPETTTTVEPTTASEPATTATTTTTGQQPGGRMNLLFAFFLIIVGIGVLIVLFRASD